MVDPYSNAFLDQIILVSLKFLLQAFTVSCDRALDVRDPRRVEGRILLIRSHFCQSANCLLILPDIFARFGFCYSGLERINGKKGRCISDKVEAVKSGST